MVDDLSCYRHHYMYSTANGQQNNIILIIVITTGTTFTVMHIACSNLQHIIVWFPFINI